MQFLVKEVTSYSEPDTKFFISTLNGKYDFNVERIYNGESIEKYKISQGDKNIILRNNIPLLKLKGSKTKKIEWKIEKGEIKNIQTMSTMILEIEKKLKEVD